MSTMNDRGRIARKPVKAIYELNWNDEEARRAWALSEERVLKTSGAFLEFWAGRGRARLIDIGCGAGRHSLAMGASGFEVCACDAHTPSVRTASQAMAAAGITGRVAKAFMSSLPWPDGYFDFALAWNVFYHGARPDLERALREARRVMAPGAWLEATFISKRNRYYGCGLSIDPWTWISEGGEDKTYPHCYLDRNEVQAALQGFAIDELEEYEQPGYEGAWHWHVVARKEV
jgi:tellurite methyltransferase